MNTTTILYGLVVAGALIASAISPHADRKAVCICASGLVASWLVFITSWAPWSMDMLLTRYGPVEVHSIDLWAMMNCMNALLALGMARHRWWGIALFGLLLNGCIADVLWWAHLIEWSSFKTTIDCIAAGEWAIFYMIGGRSAADIAVDRFRRWRVFPVRGYAGITKALSRRGQ